METPESIAAHSAHSPGRVGRPRAWTASRSRRLARLYLGTTLSVESIIKVVMPDDDVKVNSAQKTMHDMLGNDPRSLRPGSREDMNQRFRWFRRSFNRGRSPVDITSADKNMTQSDATGDHSDVTLTKHDARLFDYLKGPTVATAEGTRMISPTYPNFSPESMTLHWDTPQDGPADCAPSPRLSWAGPSRPRRQNTVFSHLTNMSTDSVRRVKRISTMSTVYAKQVTVLLRRLSLGSTCDSPYSSAASQPPVDLLVLEPDNFDGPDGPVLVPPPEIALPGDFLCRHLFRTLYCIGEQDVRHPQTCWCSIADDADLATNSHSAFGWQPAPGHQGSSLPPDRFGNTMLHVLAASRGQQQQLFTLLQQSSEIAAVNSAGQTFLHVLAPDWFASLFGASGLVDASSPLPQLLAHLRTAAPHLMYIRDVYGRTFFHILHQVVGETHSWGAVTNVAPSGVIRERDAFGVEPFLDPFRTAAPPHMLPRRAMTLSPLVEDEQDRVIKHHQQLLWVVTNVENDPLLEDDQGRNALHCLAEADVNLACEQSSSNLASKRKRGKAPAGAESCMARRLRFLEGLLRVVRADAINHYDRRGDTALMAFVSHLSDDPADSKSIALGRIFDLLLEALPRSSGGAAAIDARSRRGETALLIAARLGRRTALTRLLDRGANPYARDTRGRGVLEIVGERGCEVGTTNVGFYGKLLACGSAVFGNKTDKERGKFPDAPTRCDEWAVRRH